MKLKLRKVCLSSDTSANELQGPRNCSPRFAEDVFDLDRVHFLGRFGLKAFVLVVEFKRTDFEISRSPLQTSFTAEPSPVRGSYQPSRLNNVRVLPH